MALTPQLMFDGTAEAAIEFWSGLFPATRILSMTRYEDGEMEGKILQAVVELDGREVRVIDTPPVHNFGFTPRISFFIDGIGRDEVTRLYTALAEGGNVLMELGAYDFSPWYGWVEDRFGVSWQLAAGAVDV